MDNLEKTFIDNGYFFKPHNGPSGRPRWFKDEDNGVIFFFPMPDGNYHLLVRKVLTKFLEDIIDEIVTQDQIYKKIERLKLFKTL